MSKNIVSDDRNKPKYVNSEGTPLPHEWQKYIESNRHWTTKIPYKFDEDLPSFLTNPETNAR